MTERGLQRAWALRRAMIAFGPGGGIRSVSPGAVRVSWAPDEIGLSLGLLGRFEMCVREGGTTVTVLAHMLHIWDSV